MTADGGRRTAVWYLTLSGNSPETMAYKFENLEVWQRSLDYADTAYEIADELPKHERYSDRDHGRQSADGGGALPATKRTY